MAGDEIIARTQSSAPAAVRKDDDSMRVGRKAENTLQDECSFRNFYAVFLVFLWGGHGLVRFFTGLQGAGRLSSGGNLVWSSTQAALSCVCVRPMADESRAPLRFA